MRDQEGWQEHAAFMNILEEEHFLKLGGPLGNYSKHRALLIISAANEQILRTRLSEDPWMRTGILRVIHIFL